VEQVCERIGSTGLYPYARCDIGPDVFDARQFPKSSGFPEDAATGIAATALAFGLLANGVVKADRRSIKVRQGRAMGCPSEIIVRFQLDAAGHVNGCWVGGNVRFKK
jgi:predicted PhzF superfamily epimerase YddE/YHI9